MDCKVTLFPAHTQIIKAFRWLFSLFSCVNQKKAVPLHTFSTKTDMEISLITLIDFIGTYAFAISGIRLASKKEFDLFGAYIVGLATAVGGGTIRDLMLDVTPFWMTQWVSLAVTGFALVTYLLFNRQINRLGHTMFIFDTIGLALFTVVGFQKTMDAGFAMWVAIIMGMFTGAIGGVLRDILINEEPLIFRHDIYALACILGGLVYAMGEWMGWPSAVSQILCAAMVIVMRLMAVHYHWQLPVLHYKQD